MIMLYSNNSLMIFYTMNITYLESHLDILMTLTFGCTGSYSLYSAIW